MDKEQILNYYRVNRIPYTLFQFHTDLIHVGISRDGRFKREDLLEGVRVVESYIRKLNACHVLELATGRGANSFFLADLFPSVKFYGIDLSKVQLRYAKHKARKVKNFSPLEGNFHDLGIFESSEFDVVFVLESLCYSNQKNRVFNEVYRVLNPGGVFIIIDGYLSKLLVDETYERQLAFRLMEKGVAVEQFEHYNSVRDVALAAGFALDCEEDVTAYVLPFMLRYERLAGRFFTHPILARLVGAVLPKAFIYNALSGFLFPDIIEAGLFKYMITVFKKQV